MVVPRARKSNSSRIFERFPSSLNAFARVKLCVSPIVTGLRNSFMLSGILANLINPSIFYVSVIVFLVMLEKIFKDSQP